MRKIAYKTKSGRYVLDNGDRVMFDGRRWREARPEYGEFFVYEPVYKNEKIVGFEPKERCYTRARRAIQSKAGVCIMLGALAILCIAGFKGYCGDMPVDEVLIRFGISIVLGGIGFALCNDADKRGL